MQSENIHSVVEAYYDVSRSLIEVPNVSENFVPEVLIVDGELMEKNVAELGLALGAVGDKLLEVGLIELVGIPVNSEHEDEYDFVKANLKATILTSKQVEDLGIGSEVGLRVGFLKSDFSGKFVFFRVPEVDVCEFFSKKVDTVNREVVANSVVEHKNDLNLSGDGYIDVGRKIYGLWRDAVSSDNFLVLNKVMSEVYQSEKFAGSDLNGVLAVLQIGLSQEADLPADNWWLARRAVLKALEILENDGCSYLPESINEVRKIVSEIAYKCFYPEMLYKFVVEPLSKVNYGDGVKLLDSPEMAEIKNRVQEYSIQKKTVTK